MEDLCFSIRGGLRDGWLNVTWPLVCLKVFPGRIQLAGMTIPKGEIQSISRYEGWFSSGVKIVWGSKPRSIIFWTFDPSAVLSGLEHHGYAVSHRSVDESTLAQDPRQRRFQFHLSTAIILMLVAAGVLGLNVLPSAPEKKEIPGLQLESTGYGWPAKYLYRTVKLADTRPYAHGDEWDEWYPEWSAVAFDLFVCMLLLWITFRFCELVIRLTAAFKKGNQNSAPSDR